MNKLIVFSRDIISKILRRIGGPFYKIATVISPIAPPEISRAIQDWRKAEGDKTLRLRYDLTQESIAFDLGGFEGQWASDIFAMYCCNVYIFEPVSKYYDYIVNRFARNPKIRVYQFGLAGKNLRTTISLADNSSSIVRSIPNAQIAEIQLIKIDNFMNHEIISFIDLIKINIEGAESDLLESLINSNLVLKLRNIQVQFHNFLPDAEQRMEEIQRRLEETHKLTYQYKFVWENWTLK